MNQKLIPNKIIINASEFDDLEGFYTTIYSKMKLYDDWKPAHNLDALNDMMYSGFGSESIILVWKNASKSKNDIGLQASIHFYQQKINHGKPYNVAWAKQKIEELNAGNGQTLFDIIVEIIQTQKHIQLKLM